MYAIRWKSPTGCIGGGLYVLSEAQADDWLQYLNSAHRDYTHWKTKDEGKEDKLQESRSKKEKENEKEKEKEEL